MAAYQVGKIMFLIKKPKLKHIRSLKPLYGLPKKIVYCKLCTYTNQKPNSEKEYKHKITTQKPTLKIDQTGICDACKIEKQKKKIDWISREKLLKKLCQKYRKKNGDFDCIVPGSGGKDSFYAALKLKEEYGMNPLTVTAAPHMYTDWGRKNFYSWLSSGFTNYLFTPNIKVQRLLTRLSLENIFHPFQPFIMGQMYFPPKIALNLGIELIFYGENPSEYGNNSNENKVPKKNVNYFSSKNPNDIYIAGFKINDLIKKFKLTKNDLSPYLPVAQNKINGKINVQYLGYYMPWHPQECYYYASEKGGFEASPERNAGTYSKYVSLDDKMDDLHWYTTYIKFGIGRATYDTSQEIRNEELTREEGFNLVKKYDGEYPYRFEKEIFEYLSINKEEYGNLSKVFEQTKMTRNYFNSLSDKFRSSHIWHKKKNKWKIKS
jgi:N-acetyl sugar amidotransferase